MTAQPISAASIAVAIVAACGEVGVKPETVFERQSGCGRARILAAAGCVARLGWKPKDAARVFRVTSTNLAPSSLSARKVTAEQIAVVAAALVPGGECTPARFRQATTPDPVAAPASPSPPDPKPVAPPVTEASLVPKTLTSISDEVLGWARRMRAPGAEGKPAWTFGEISKLFGLDADELREVLS
ncbi:hypothetical protein [Brevundimonas sp. DC300-4]|uniref:hypothetical protein n=1 Tax=Brevundimonas sp. DC300-4 TaxID=2804594 RepID=UPI003CE69029